MISLSHMIKWHVGLFLILVSMLLFDASVARCQQDSLKPEPAKLAYVAPVQIIAGSAAFAAVFLGVIGSHFRRGSNLSNELTQLSCIFVLDRSGTLRFTPSSKAKASHHTCNLTALEVFYLLVNMSLLLLMKIRLLLGVSLFVLHVITFSGVGNAQEIPLPTYRATLQVGTNYYAGFGLNVGVEFGQLVISNHYVSVGLEVCTKHLDTRNNPALALLIDSGAPSMGMYVSIPLLYKVQYQLTDKLNKLTSCFIVGINPLLGGPIDPGGVGTGDFFRHGELNAVIGHGWMYDRFSLEFKAGIPLIDPFTRPKNPSEYRAHVVLIGLLGIRIGD